MTVTLKQINILSVFFRGTFKGNKATGEITLHGVTKNIEIPINKIEEEKKISITTEFKIALKDHKIKVPRVLFQNIAEEIEVKVSSTFTEFQQQ